jgi:hypothetical protein
LSLFGGDPQRDYDALVNEREGRRVNLHAPQESLILLKATGEMDHGGGQRFPADSTAAQMLRQWIQQGAARGASSPLVRLDVQPAAIRVESPQRIEPLVVVAHFADGTGLDVSNWSTYWTSDDQHLSSLEGRRYALSRPGRYWIFARYLTHVVGVPVTAPLPSEPLDAHPLVRLNWIDDTVNATLAELRISPAPLADDATFLRRVHLDLTGRLPPPDEVTRFLEDTSTAKRQRVIDRLLASDEATEYWTYRLAQWLRFQIPAGDVEAGETFYQWLRQQVAVDRGWDQIVRDLMSARGDSHEVGPASFHRLVPDARSQAEYFSEVMLGVRLRCANCHNHPLDRWTQDDYHGLAQVFAPLQRGRVVAEDGRAFLIHPRTERPAIARIPGERCELDSGGNASVDTLTTWLLAEDNPYFAQAIVGRIWRSLMGRGIIEPVDDTRPTNPPSDARLLAQLTETFVDHRYRLRYLIGEICRSAAYQRGAATPQADPLALQSYAFSHRRVLSAEVLADAIADVTGLPSPGAGARRTLGLVAAEPETVETLRVLGHCDPSTGCVPENDTAARTAAAHLQLLNGTILNDRIVADHGVLSQFTSSGATVGEIVNTLYLRALSRPPNEVEKKYWAHQFDTVADVADRQERLEDFLWSLLNCQDFVTNH